MSLFLCVCYCTRCIHNCWCTVPFPIHSYTSFKFSINIFLFIFFSSSLSTPLSSISPPYLYFLSSNQSLHQSFPLSIIIVLLLPCFCFHAFHYVFYSVCIIFSCCIPHCILTCNHSFYAYLSIS